MKVDEIHIPADLNDSYVHQENIFQRQGRSILLASAQIEKLALNLEYNVGKFGVGTHLTYFGKVRLLGFRWTGLQSAEGTGGPGDPAISGSFTGIDPYVDIDGYGYDNRVYVTPEIFNYQEKLQQTFMLLIDSRSR